MSNALTALDCTASQPALLTKEHVMSYQEPISTSEVPTAHYGRHWAFAWIDIDRYGGLWYDHECVMGFDEGLKTYYFQSGDVDEGAPVVWLGTKLREFTTFTGLWNALLSAGVLCLEWKFGRWGALPPGEAWDPDNAGATSATSHVGPVFTDNGESLTAAEFQSALDCIGAIGVLAERAEANENTSDNFDVVLQRYATQMEAAESVVRRFAEQMQPAELATMQETYYAFTNDKRNTHSNEQMVAITSTIKRQWHGIGPWQA